MIKYKLPIRLFIIICSFLGIVLNMIVSSINATIPILGAFNSFLYFTLQSNLLVLIWFINSVVCSYVGKTNFIDKPFYKGAITSYITLTFLIFLTILQPTYQPQGLHLVSSLLLHYIVPILVMIDWVFYEVRKTYHFHFLLKWMIYPVLYAIVGVILALTIDKFLYPFFDLSLLGWLVIPYILMLSIMFALIGTTYILFNQKLSNHKNV